MTSRLIVCLALCVGVLVGCGGEDADSSAAETDRTIGEWEWGEARDVEGDWEGYRVVGTSITNRASFLILCSQTGLLRVLVRTDEQVLNSRNFVNEVQYRVTGATPRSSNWQSDEERDSELSAVPPKQLLNYLAETYVVGSDDQVLHFRAEDHYGDVLEVAFPLTGLDEVLADLSCYDPL